MVITVDNCTGCRTIFGNCLRTACPNRARKIVVCDDCGVESNELYKYNDKILCIECLIDQFEKLDVEWYTDLINEKIERYY